MAYVVTARWVAKEGEEDRVFEAIRNMIAPSRAEAGCLYYQPNRDPEDSRVFFFYELYTDEEAYKAHGESEHFQRHAVGEAIPLLDSRERWFYQTIDV
jgi:quinol monooxygenase YgiN